MTVRSFVWYIVAMATTTGPIPKIFRLPLFLSPVRAGFPSPADDFIDLPLDLNEHLIQHPAATFCVRAQGDSMINAGIFPGSILIVDRSLEAHQNSIIVAVLEGDFTVKRYRKLADRIILVAENPKYRPIEIRSEQDFEVWGVVVHAIRTFA